MAECEQALEQALDLAAGARLTKRLYQRLATSNGLLSMSSIQRAGSREEPGLTWAGLPDRVIERRAQQPRQQGRRPARKPRFSS